jgi:hypothetical protein
MKNKKFFIGMAVLLSVSLFVIGCPTEVDEKIIDNSKTVGAAAGLAALRTLLNKPGVNPVAYEGVLAIGNEQIIVPADKTLVATDGVTLGASGRFIVAGGLDLGQTGKIGVTGAGLVIGDKDAVLDKIDDDGSAVQGVLAANVTAATAAFAESDVVMVPTASDTELGSTSVPANTVLYVSETLSLAGVPAATGAIVTLGTVSVSANVDLSAIVDATASDGKLVIADATLINTAVATVTLPAAVAVKAVNVGSANLTIAGATDLTAEVTGTGTLVLSGAVTKAAITGNGKVAFTNATTPTAFATSASSITAGTITFTNGFSTAASAPVTLSGAVVLPDAAVITFGHATGTLTLKEGTTIAVFDASATPVLRAEADTLLTPVASATLTAAKAESPSPALLSLGDANLAVTSGELSVPADAGFAIGGTETLTLGTGATLGVTGTLTLTTGGTLIVGTGTATAGLIILEAGTWTATGAAATIEPNKITLGNNASAAFGAGAAAVATVLTGTATTTNTFTASGGTVTLAQDTNALTITGSVADAVLTTGATAGISVKASDTLTIASATVTAGNIILGAGTWKATGAAATIKPSVITLGNNASATFGKDDGTAATVLTGTATTTNTFTASGGTVTLAQDTNALTITGSVEAAVLATGDTAGISEIGGLTIATVTVDISGADTSVIELKDNGVGITLAADGVILLDSSKATTETDSKKDIDDLTVGASVEVWAETDAGNVEVGKFVGAATANTIVESGSGFEIKKGNNVTTAS